MPVFGLGPSPFDRFASLWRKPQPPPDPFAALDAQWRHPFYSLPQAQQMEEMGGIDPRDVTQLDPKGGAFTRGVTRGVLGLGEGAAELASHLPGLVIPGAKPDEKLQGAADFSSQMRNVLSTEYERKTPIEQQLLQHPVKTIGGALGESLPSMLAASAGPVGIAAAGLASGGQQSRQFREQGIEGARNLVPSIASGLTVGLLERAGINPTLKGVAAPRITRLLVQALSEGSTEALQAIPEVLAEVGAGAREGETAMRIVQDTFVRMGRAGLLGTAVGGAVGTITPSKAQIKERELLIKKIDEMVIPPEPSPAIKAVQDALDPVGSIERIGDPALIAQVHDILRKHEEELDRLHAEKSGKVSQREMYRLVQAQQKKTEAVIRAARPAALGPVAQSATPPKDTDPEAGFARFPAERLRTWWQQNMLTPMMRRAHAPGLHGIMSEHANKAVAHAEAIDLNQQELTKQVRALDVAKLPQPLQDPKNLAEFLDKAYRGLVPKPTMEMLLPTLVEPINAMREHQSKLEREGRRLGLWSDASARDLERKFGLHVHRDFQTRFGPEYQALVQEQPFFRRAFELWRDEELADAFKAAEKAYLRYGKTNFKDVPDAPPTSLLREKVLSTWREERRIRPDGDEEIVGVVSVPKVRAQRGTFDEETGGPAFDLVADPWSGAVEMQDFEVKSQQQLEGKLLEYITWANKGSGIPLPGGSIEGAKNRAVSMQRDQEMRDIERMLLGEIRDPVANYVNSVHQMAAQIENEKFLRRLKAEGLNKWLFHEPRPGFTKMVDPSAIAMPILKGGQVQQPGIMEQVDPSSMERGTEGQQADLLRRRGMSPATNPTKRKVTADEQLGGPLGPLYTSDAVMAELEGGPADPIAIVKQALAESSSGYGAIGQGALSAWLMASHAVRAGATVGSIQGTNRNYLSNMLFLAGNAHNPAVMLGGILQGASHMPGLGILSKLVPQSVKSKTAVAYQPVVEAFYNLTATKHTKGRPLDRQLLEKRQRYLELGLIRQSTTVGDLNRLGAMAYKATAAGLKKNPARFREVMKLATELYMSHDDLPKIAAFEHELAVLGKAHAVPGGGPVDYRALEREAAEKVNRTMQNYSDLPHMAHVIAANPIIGPFFSYNASLVRNAVNTLVVGIEEVRSGNPVLVKRGAARLGAFVATMALPSAMAAVGRHWSNTEPEEEEALRKIGYPWSRNSQVVILSRNGTEVSYLDLGFLDGYDKLKSPVVAAMRRMQNGEPIDEGFLDALAETADLAGMNLDLFTKALLETTTGTRYEGGVPIVDMEAKGRLWQSTDPGLEKLKRAAKHMAYSVSPGVGKTGERIRESVVEQDPQQIAGRQRKLSHELLAVLGPRIVTFDLRDRLGSDVKNFVRLRADATTKAKRDKRERGRSSADAHGKVLDDLMQKVEAYKTLGMTGTQIKRVLTDAGAGKELASAIAFDNRRKALRLMTSKLEVN